MLKIRHYEERGDAPAQAILQSNSQARAIRKAAETQEELGRIKERVVRTLDTYDLSEKLSAGHVQDKAEVDRIAEEYIREQANLEFIDDMTQLTIILGDPVAKRKYQQQVTVFIVGFENLCGRRAKLLAQLQEFFNQNTADDSKFDLEPPEVDWDDMGVQVSDALAKAEKATKRLATVSKDVIKALELANPKESKKGKKKLEKALHQSHQDIMSLTEKLLKVQSELDQNESKMSQVYRSMEMKQVEIERLKVQADNAKKYSDEVNELKVELTNKDKEVQGLTKTSNELELTVAQLEDKMERDYERNRHLKEESQRIKSEFEEKLRDQQKYLETVQTEMKQHYDSEVKKLRSEQELTLYYLKQDHETQIKRKERAIETAKKKNEELKTKADLSATESSPRNSLYTESPVGKLTSPFSPDSSEGEGTQGRVSLKSSAQSIRMMLRKSGTETSAGSPQDSGVQSPLVDSPTKMLSRSESVEQSKSDLKEQPSKTPETPKPDSSKNRKSKSPDSKPGRRSKSPQKTVRVKTPEEETAGEKAEETVTETNEKVEKVDASVQSDSEDQEVVKPKAILRRTSTLQVVHEHDTDLEEDAEIDWANLSPEELLARAEMFKVKSLQKIESLDRELSEWKTKYLKKTDSLRRELAEAQGLHVEEKENLLNQLKEAQSLKEQAENEAVQAVLQLEEILAEQEEMRLVQEKSLAERRDENTMTGMSLRSVRSVENRDTMTGKSLDSTKQSLHSDSYHSFVSRGVSPFPIMESSTQEDTVGEEHGDHKPSPRDSGFEGAGSSVRFDSRPESGSDNTASVFSSRLDKIDEPSQISRSNTLAAPRREIVMSARARRRLVSSALRDHPVASETLRTYESVLRFKENITKWLDIQGLFVEMEELKKVEMTAVSKANLAELIERIPEIRYSITQVLDKVSNIISSQSLVRESTMTTEAAIKTSAESTRYETTDLQPAEDVDAGEETPANSSHKQQLESNYGKLLKEYNDLAEGYETLKKHLDEETKFHQEQTSQNAAVMADMQETINKLQMQLDDVLGGRPYSRRASSSIMFSRLDAERNAKIIKRAINEKRLTDGDVTNVFDHMSNYVSLPAKRLSIIVQRYRHHHAMQIIEEQLKKNGANLDEKVLQKLENMERLQNERAKRWGYKMDDLATTRERLAQLMMETFEKLENDTGIFLIKPVLSYQSRTDPFGGYVVSNKKHSSTSRPGAANDGPSAPAPTPFLSTGKASAQTRGTKTTPSIPAMTKLDGGGMEISATQQGGEMTYSTQTWDVSKSQSHGSPALNVAINIPRMLELDVNRMMIGQTQASTGFVASSDTGEVPSSLIRGYVTVERPSGSKQVKKTRQPSMSDYSYDAMVPHLRNSPANLRYSPLPPIRMPEIRQDSRASKSLRSYPESEAMTQSVPGSPTTMERLGQVSPTRLAMDEERVLSPDVVPVR